MERSGSSSPCAAPPARSKGHPEPGRAFTAAAQILELIEAGRTVGIIDPSLTVIHNLIGKVTARADELGIIRPRICQRAGRAARLHPDPSARVGLWRAGSGTAISTWPRRGFWPEQFQGGVDTLFIDETGQMSLANILAVVGVARGQH